MRPLWRPGPSPHWRPGSCFTLSPQKAFNSVGQKSVLVGDWAAFPLNANHVCSEVFLNRGIRGSFCDDMFIKNGAFGMPSASGVYLTSKFSCEVHFFIIIKAAIKQFCVFVCLPVIYFCLLVFLQFRNHGPSLLAPLRRKNIYSNINGTKMAPIKAYGHFKKCGIALLFES